MNFPESQQILEEIKKANKLLLNCHRSPDPDSFGSALAMYEELLKMGKQVEIICPTEGFQAPEHLKFRDQIKFVHFQEFNFKEHDLLIVIDSSSWDQVTDIKDFIPDIKTLVIDHHASNDNYGEINLVKQDISSASEIVFRIFEDWNSEITQSQATALLTGIIGDTGVFQYPGVTAETFEVAMKLMSLGADKDEIIFNIYRMFDEHTLRFIGLVLANLKIDSEHKFVWSAIKFEDFEKVGAPQKSNGLAASMFFQNVKDTNFGFVMVETEEGQVDVSFRARTGLVDTSRIAVELGGGGHKAASGAEITGKTFDEAVNLILETAKKHARSSS